MLDSAGARRSPALCAARTLMARPETFARADLHDNFRLARHEVAKFGHDQ
jgi:hypothetical protein